MELGLERGSRPPPRELPDSGSALPLLWAVAGCMVHVYSEGATERERRGENEEATDDDSSTPMSRTLAGELVTALTTAADGEALDCELLARLKAAVRSNDEELREAFGALLQRLHGDDSRSRLRALALADWLFTRSKLFRALLAPALPVRHRLPLSNSALVAQRSLRLVGGTGADAGHRAGVAWPSRSRGAPSAAVQRAAWRLGGSARRTSSAAARGAAGARLSARAAGSGC
jgi:hypothetical protein